MKLPKRIDLIYLIILLVLSGFAWRFISDQVIRSDGFMYFISGKQQEFFSRDFFYTGFELSAMSLGWLLPKLYGINNSLYWWNAYVVMLFTNVLFFWFAKTIFKKSFLAFSASLLFALNYFGNWDLYSTHCYCFILERIYPVLFLLPSAVFLHKFLELRNSRDFKWSLLLFFIGLGIGHWSLFITAFFLLYPICWAIFKQHSSERVKDSIRGLTYLGITLFFVFIQRVHESVFQLKWSAIDFLLHPEVSAWPEKVVRQFVHWTQYPVLLQGDLHALMVSKISNASATAGVTPYIVFLYVLVFVIIYKALPQKRALLVTALAGTASIFFINVFFGQYDVFYQPGSNRYLYYPTMLLALFWTLFLEVLIVGQKSVLKTIAITLVVGYALINMRLIQESYIESMGYNTWTKRVYEYIKTHAKGAPRGTLIVAPYDEVGFYESTFFTQQLKSKGVRVMSIYTYPGTDMWEHVASTSSHVIILEKNKECGCIKEHVLK